MPSPAIICEANGNVFTPKTADEPHYYVAETINMFKCYTNCIDYDDSRNNDESLSLICIQNHYYSQYGIIFLER